jgi:hypothetical protein
MQFEIRVQDKDVVVGYISLSRFLGFWWLSDGATVDYNKIARIRIELYGRP